MIKLFRPRAERKREKLIEEREWLFDALAEHAYAQIQKDPGSTHTVSPIVNSHAEHTYSSGMYTVPDGYVNDTDNIVIMHISHDRWGDLPSLSEHDTRSIPAISELAIRFGSAAYLYANASERGAIPDPLDIKVDRSELLDPDAMDRLALIEIAIKAALAGASDTQMPSEAELQRLTNARVTHSYRDFSSYSAVDAMVTAQEKARIAADTPVRTEPNGTGWQTYPAETPVPLEPSRPPISADEKANVAILLAAADAAPERTFKLPEKDPTSNGYAIETFKDDYSAQKLPNEYRDQIVALAIAQANHAQKASASVADAIRGQREMLVIGQPIEKLPLGEDMAKYEFLLTEEAYEQTVSEHPEWFAPTSRTERAHTPTIYWITGTGKSLAVRCNTPEIPRNAAIDQHLRWSNHIGMRNIVAADAMPKVVALSFVKRNKRPGYIAPAKPQSRRRYNTIGFDF